MLPRHAARSRPCPCRRPCRPHRTGMKDRPLVRLARDGGKRKAAGTATVLLGSAGVLGWRRGRYGFASCSAFFVGRFVVLEAIGRAEREAMKHEKIRGAGSLGTAADL